MFSGKLGVVLRTDNFFSRNSGFEKFQNKVHHNSCTFKTRFTVTYVRVNSDMVSDVHVINISKTKDSFKAPV